MLVCVRVALLDSVTVPATTDVTTVPEGIPVPTTISPIVGTAVSRGFIRMVFVPETVFPMKAYTKPP
jgi:hypothetical protein